MPHTDYSPTIIRTPQEASRRLGDLCTPQTLYRWRKAGTGPRFVKIGRRVGYLDRDLDAYIEAQVRTHTGQTSVQRDARHRAGA